MTELVSFEIQISFATKRVGEKTSDELTVSNPASVPRTIRNPPDHFMQRQSSGDDWCHSCQIRHICVYQHS